MPRKLRIQYPGGVYHVMARGNQGGEVFRDSQDRKLFLTGLGEACAKTGWQVHAYVLMPNHYHVLLQNPWYLTRAGKRPVWLRVERVMESLGLGPADGRGYEAYLEGRVLELGTKAGRKELDRQWKALRRGWYVGGKSFVAKSEGYLGPRLKGRRRESFSGGAKARHDTAAAEQALAVGLRALGLREAELAGLAKGAAEKVALAWSVRQRTTVPLRWVSQRLAMGHYSRVTQALSRVRRRPGRKLQRLQRRLARALDDEN